MSSVLYVYMTNDIINKEITALQEQFNSIREQEGLKQSLQQYAGFLIGASLVKSVVFFKLSRKARR